MNRVIVFCLGICERSYTEGFQPAMGNLACRCAIGRPCIGDLVVNHPRGKRRTTAIQSARMPLTGG